MFNEDEILAEVAADLRESIQAASRDYFLWTRGSVIFEHGVEALMHVYAAKRLSELFALQYGAMVRMEQPIGQILAGVAGRADVALSFPGGPTIVIEFKRFMNAASIAADIARLRMIAAVPQHHGILAGPCFIRQGTNDWVDQLAANIMAGGPGLVAQPSDVRLLPAAFRQPGGYDRSRSIAVRVGV